MAVQPAFLSLLPRGLSWCDQLGYAHQLYGTSSLEYYPSRRDLAAHSFGVHHGCR